MKVAHAFQNQVSNVGKWGYVIALLLTFSISADYRLPIFGLLVHPYLLLLPFAIIFSKYNLFAIPKSVSRPLIIFFLVLSLASLQNLSPYSESFKVFASVITFLFFVQCVRSEKDFRLIAWGFIFCALVIALRSLFISEIEDVSRFSGINALEGIGNKNAQSLFTLPAIFLGFVLLLKYVGEKSVVYFVIVLGIIFLIVISVFLSANRSGWLGLLVVGITFVFYNGISLRSIIMAFVMFGIVYLAIDRFASDIVQHKREQTEEGYASDEGRQKLAWQAFEVGLENPIIGVGMDELHRQMAIRLGISNRGRNLIDTHILWGYLFGAAGILAPLMFGLFLFSMTKRHYRFKNRELRKYVWKYRYLMIGFVVLFVLRASFTREILYSPTFMGAMGLLFGYYLMQIRYAQELSKA